MLPKIFGKNPSGSSLAHIEKYANYKNGQFQNLSPTGVMQERGAIIKTIRDNINKPKDTNPLSKLPFEEFTLQNTVEKGLNYAWFGHSSYFLEYNRFRILVDPVFSGSASPVGGFVKAFNGADHTKVEQFDAIDLLILTHDHYDHLDYKTIVALAPKVKHILTSLGVANHLTYWEIPSDKITELNWWQTAQINKDLKITATPTRHFSGRGLVRAKTLWSSFVVNWFDLNLYIGSDSGYDTHFKTIGEESGPFDFAWLECGQYGKYWPQIHMLPEETVQATIDLKAKNVLPVHWGKFALSMHSWNEPINRFIAAAKNKPFNVIVPKIGAVTNLLTEQPIEPWWNF
jgi:L-ascorbate metabolism protein UlaG (beta-lactamase superfamily)